MNFLKTGFWKREMRNKFIFDLRKINLLKSFGITPPSEFKTSAKSMFLVIDISSMYIHTPKVEDKHWLLIQECIKMTNKRDYVVLCKFSNCDLKRISASIFAQKCGCWAKYPYVVSECALKSLNTPQLAPAPVFFGDLKLKLQPLFFFFFFFFLYKF